MFEQTEYAAAILRGTALYNEDRYEESIAAWESVLTLNPYYRQAYDKIGMALYQMKQYREAMTYFEKAGDQEPVSYTHLFHVGRRSGQGQKRIF